MNRSYKQAAMPPTVSASSSGGSLPVIGSVFGVLAVIVAIMFRRHRRLGIANQPSPEIINPFLFANPTDGKAVVKRVLYRQPDCWMGRCYQEKIAEDEEIPQKLIEYTAIEYEDSGYFCVVYNIKDEDDPDDYVKLLNVFKTDKYGGCADNCKKPNVLFLIEIRNDIPMSTSNNHKEVCFSIQE